MAQSPQIETKRLILTWPTSKQIEQYYQDIIGTNMFDTIHWDGPCGPEELRDYWQDCKKADPTDTSLNLSVAIIDKQSGKCMGGASLRPVDENPATIDIGYAFAPKFHGKGYATEAVCALVDEAFRSRGAQRIFASIFVGNQASRNVVEKLGFVLEGTKRHTSLKRGTWMNEWHMAIIRPDWEHRLKKRNL